MFLLSVLGCKSTVCTASVTNLQHIPDDARAHVVATALHNHAPAATATVPPVFSAESRVFGCTEESELELMVLSFRCSRL